MIGMVRQGHCCADCKYYCHVHCTDKVPQICPVPEDQGFKSLFIKFILNILL